MFFGSIFGILNIAVADELLVPCVGQCQEAGIDISVEGSLLELTIKHCHKHHFMKKQSMYVIYLNANMLQYTLWWFYYTKQS